MQTLPVTTEEKPPVEQLLAESLLPYMLGDSKKAVYLSYRATGFAVREAIRLAGVTQRTVQRWRASDPTFNDIDGDKLPEIRKKLGANFTQLEFLRNYRLVLLKDFRIIKKSLSKDELTKNEQSYLIKARSNYTPQQLEILQRLLGEGAPESPRTFAQLVIAIHQGRQESKEDSVEAEYREVSG